MGVQYATLLAVFSALIWLIPWLGGVLALASITVVAPSMGILAGAYTLGLLFLLEFLIKPRFIRRGQFSTLLSILLIIALVEPFGLLGFIVAPPLAAAIELLVRYNLQMRGQPLGIESAQRISQLRARVDHLRAIDANGETQLEPSTRNILGRLEKLVDRADEVVKTEGKKSAEG